MAKNAGQGSFSEEVKRKFGTIYTPDFVVEKTADLAFKHYKGDLLNSTFCDPAAGDGNFLAYAYKELMSDSKSPEQSFHILTKCLWGFEIIDSMVKATKIRMLLLHLETTGDRSMIPELFEKLNIHHGNTICLPKDTEEEWYKSRVKFEGGLLPEEIRSMKFDVIIGNPPYTHLRNLNNRRYTAYPKQRDMAQVFVRWALDHLTEDGVCSYNTTDAWLLKTTDGAVEVRKLLIGRLAEIVQSDDIRKYSENDGGDVGTFLIAFANDIGPKSFAYDDRQIDYTDDEICSAGYIQQLRNKAQTHSFVAVSITKYAPELKSGRSSNKFGTNTTKWKSFVYKDYGGDTTFLIAKRRLLDKTYLGSYKLIMANAFSDVLHSDFEGAVNNTVVQREYGLWLLGFLNTKVAAERVTTYTRTRSEHGDGWTAHELSNNLWPLLQVPDYDWYLVNRPEQTKAFLRWVEINMVDKDMFLAGIDDEFEKLVHK